LIAELLVENNDYVLLSIALSFLCYYKKYLSNTNLGSPLASTELMLEE